jgi:localization factor PodJL
MGIALLAAVSIFTFNMLGQAKKASAPTQPATIEEQLTPQVAPQSNALAAPEATAPAAPEATAPDALAKPPQPKPAQIEGMLMPEGSDPVLTGSIEKAGQDNLQALIAGVASTSDDMPPANSGSTQLREAAAMGNAEAQFIIASRYLNGEDGVDQDFAKAAYWYGKAAASGNAPAQYRLGTLYERGKGVARDTNAALGWYERAGALGNVKAMHNAAVLAAGTDQRQPDYGRAFKWFSLGAAHGLKDSQFNLAVLLERGLGTKANAKEALFWYSMAAKQNDAEANKRSDKLAKTFTPADLQDTKERLANWTPEIAPDSANAVAVRDAAWQASTPDAG